jgi:hypothetical protein
VSSPACHAMATILAVNLQSLSLAHSFSLLYLAKCVRRKTRCTYVNFHRQTAPSVLAGLATQPVPLTTLPTRACHLFPPFDRVLIHTASQSHDYSSITRPWIPSDRGSPNYRSCSLSSCLCMPLHPHTIMFLPILPVTVLRRIFFPRRV